MPPAGPSFKKDLSPLFGAMFFGAFNDNLLKNALAIIITYQGVSVMGLGPKTVVALSMGIFILPFFLFSPMAGILADRKSKSKMIVATKISEIIIMLLAAVGFYFHLLEFLLFVLFLMGAQSAFFGPLKYGSIPELVGQERIVTANALFASGTFISILLGTILGGILGGRASSVVIGATVVGLSLVGLLVAIKTPFRPPQNPGLKMYWSPYQSIRRNLKLVRDTPGAKELIISISWFWAIGALILSLIPPMAKDYLQASDLVATGLLGAFTIGIGAGSFFFKSLLGPIPGRGIPQWCLLAMNLGLLAVAVFSPKSPEDPPASVALFAGVLFLISFFGAGYVVPLNSLVQIKFSGKNLSQFISGGNLYNALFMAGSSVASGLILWAGGEIWAIFYLLCAIVGLVSVGQYRRHLYDFYHSFAQILFRPFYKVKVRGAHLIPPQGPLILITNHVSYIDWAFLIIAFKRHIHFVIDQSFYFHPLLNKFFEHVQLVPIASKKDNEKILAQAYNKIHQCLGEGEILALFPEGRISRDGSLAKFQPGIQRILRDQTVPVLLASIEGLWGSWFSYGKGKLFYGPPNPFHRREVTVTICGVVPGEDYCPEQARETILKQIDYGKL